MRLPSVSYWPPWHGQPNPAIEIVGISVASLKCLVDLSSSGPLGCTGQPRCAQWFEMMVKLGRLFSCPLFRTNAARRETSPCFSSSVNVTTTYFPSGKFEIGPMSWSFTPCLRKAGPIMNPIAGAVTMPPISPPTPSVDSSRNFDRG